MREILKILLLKKEKNKIINKNKMKALKKLFSVNNYFQLRELKKEQQFFNLLTHN